MNLDRVDRKLGDLRRLVEGDEKLRELERKVAEAPTDANAFLELFRARRRAGDPVNDDERNKLAALLQAQPKNFDLKRLSVQLRKERGEKTPVADMAKALKKKWAAGDETGDRHFEKFAKKHGFNVRIAKVANFEGSPLYAEISDEAMRDEGWGKWYLLGSGAGYQTLWHLVRAGNDSDAYGAAEEAWPDEYATKYKEKNDPEDDDEEEEIEHEPDIRALHRATITWGRRADQHSGDYQLVTGETVRVS